MRTIRKRGPKYEELQGAWDNVKGWEKHISKCFRLKYEKFKNLLVILFKMQMEGGASKDYKVLLGYLCYSKLFY